LNDRDIITLVFVYVDDLFIKVGLDPKTGPNGKLTASEIVTLMVIQPILKPYFNIKGFYKWINLNLMSEFPNMPEYSRVTRLFRNNRELVMIVMKSLCDQNSFGLLIDGTCVPVMETIRGKYAKSFRDARKVRSASKNEWYWGFLMVLLVDQKGKISHCNIDISAEVRQMEYLLEDLVDRWILGDKGFRGQDLHKRLWENNQVAIKITGGKERQWIENVFGFLKERFGLDQIRKIRKTPSFLAKIFSMLCAYNFVVEFNLAI